MTSGALLYLSRRDVEAVGLPMREVIDALEAMFAEKGAGRVEMPPKPGIHPAPDAFIHAMPAWIPAQQAAGLKWIAGYPQNMDRGLPYIHGLLVLNDPATGVPVAVMDATWITAARTGAATAVAARRLARPDSASVGVVACGVQGRSNLEALRSAFPGLTRAMAYDVRPEVARRFAADMSRALDLEVVAVERVEDAVRGLDMVVTSGPILKKPTPVIDAGWLAPGAFASPVDFDSYFTPAAFREGRVFTDDLTQFRYYRAEGYFQATPEPEADLGHLVAGQAAGRRTPDERTFAINLGLALEDMATAVRVHAEAVRRGIGTPLPL
ncbi:MAG: ornithine cyclodeaminase family protein [Planctomycetes bacterium]|nr:ornithine cyclodeaminase family protein [Planctomycetota bacterium]